MILRHLRSNVVAYLALLIAMSGTSYAAAKIANGSVTTRKLAQNAVTSQKVRNEGIQSIDVRNNSLTSSDLRDNAVNSSDLQDGSVSSVDVKDRSLMRSDLANAAVPGKADAFVSQLDAGDPVAAASADAAGLNPFAFTLPRSEKVVLRFFAGELGVTCSAGPGQVGLYVDGTPVAKTLVTVPAETATGAVELIAAPVLAAGAHTVTTGEDCAGGTRTSHTQSRAIWEVAQLAR
jgi:hypothetical protein